MIAAVSQLICECVLVSLTFIARLCYAATSPQVCVLHEAAPKGEMASHRDLLSAVF